jgi:hypothetical protein
MIIYPKYKEALINGSSNTGLNGTVKAVLLDATYAYSATDQYLSDIPAGERVAISDALTGKSYTNGTFTAADGAKFAAATGDVGTQLAFFIDTGVESTSRLVVLFEDGDVATLPVTPNGGDIIIDLDAAGIFDL